MKLAEWIKQYREINKLTLQDMADLCGFSRSYAHMLEKGVNPTTNKVVSPTILTLKKIANATGQDVDSFLKLLDDDQPVTIRPEELKNNSEERKLIDIYRQLDDDNKKLLMTLAHKLLLSQKV